MFRLKNAAGPDDPVHAHRPRQSNNVDKYVRKTSIYLVGFFANWLWGTVNRIQNMADPTNPILFLFVMHAFFTPLQGFINSVLYFWSTVMGKIKARGQTSKLERGAMGGGAAGLGGTGNLKYGNKYGHGFSTMSMAISSQTSSSSTSSTSTLINSRNGFDTPLSASPSSLKSNGSKTYLWSDSLTRGQPSLLHQNVPTSTLLEGGTSPIIGGIGSNGSSNNMIIPPSPIPTSTSMPNNRLSVHTGPVRKDLVGPEEPQDPTSSYRSFMTMPQESLVMDLTLMPDLSE